MNPGDEVSEPLMISGGYFAGKRDFPGSIDPDFGFGVIETKEKRTKIICQLRGDFSFSAKDMGVGDLDCSDRKEAREPFHRG